MAASPEISNLPKVILKNCRVWQEGAVGSHTHTHTHKPQAKPEAKPKAEHKHKRNCHDREQAIVLSKHLLEGEAADGRALDARAEGTHGPGCLLRLAVDQDDLGTRGPWFKCQPGECKGLVAHSVFAVVGYA